MLLYGFRFVVESNSEYKPCSQVSSAIWIRQLNSNMLKIWTEPYITLNRIKLRNKTKQNKKLSYKSSLYNQIKYANVLNKCCTVYQITNLTMAERRTKETSIILPANKVFQTKTFQTNSRHTKLRKKKHNFFLCKYVNDLKSIGSRSLNTFISPRPF